MVLFDGTDAREETNTAVSRIKRLFPEKPNDDTYVIYKRGVDKVTDAETGQKLMPTEIPRDVENVYAELSRQSIEAHDRIYIFGYSRGAISARALAQCITNPGMIALILPGEKLNQEHFKYRQIEFLGVFDPVFGRRNIRATPPKYEISASKSERIALYAEIVAKNEHRFLFGLRSSVADFEKKLQDLLITRPNKKPKFSGEYHKNVMANGSLTLSSKEATFAASRYFIAMNGGHADIGYQHGDPVIGSHSFLTMLSIACEQSPELRKSMVDTTIIDDAIDLIRSGGDPSPNSGLSGFTRKFRAIRNLGREFKRRKKIIESEHFVEHIANSTPPDEGCFAPEYDFIKDP